MIEAEGLVTCYGETRALAHPVAAALIWSVVILAVAAPAASHFLKRRTTD